MKNNVNEHITLLTPEYDYIGGGIGSGKSFQAMCMTVAREMENFLYVAPTHKLLEELLDDYRTHEEIDPEDVKDVVRIDSTTIDEDSKVKDEVLKLINNTESNSGKVVMLTTTTFLTVVDDIEEQGGWNIILDEAFEPIKPLVGKVNQVEMLTSYLDFSDTDNVKASIPKDELKEVIKNDVAISDAIKQVFKDVLSPVKTVALATPSVISKLKKGKDDKEGNSQIAIVSYMNPDCLKGFKEVLFMAALFETTILYLIWKASNIQFSKHRWFLQDGHKLRDVHKNKSKYISIGYLLDDEDYSSSRNFYRSYDTGKVLNKKVRSKLVIHELIDQANAYLSINPYLISYNNWVKGDPLKGKQRAIKIPAMAHGLNLYQHINDMACLITTNPYPQVAEWLSRTYELDKAYVNQVYRIQTIYQALGRTSIRDAGNDEDKIWLVASKSDAEFLYQLFDLKAEWLGKVGSMNKIPRPPAEPKPTNHPDWKKTKQRIKNVKTNIRNWDEQGKDTGVWKTELKQLDDRLYHIKLEVQMELTATQAA